MTTPGIARRMSTASPTSWRPWTRNSSGRGAWCSPPAPASTRRTTAPGSTRTPRPNRTGSPGAGSSRESASCTPDRSRAPSSGWAGSMGRVARASSTRCAAANRCCRPAARAIPTGSTATTPREPSRTCSDWTIPEPLYLGVDDEPADLAEIVAWLAERLGVPVPPAAPAGDPVLSLGRGNKRCRNLRLRSSGFMPTYPTYRQGFAALLQDHRQDLHASRRRAPGSFPGRAAEHRLGAACGVRLRRWSRPGPRAASLRPPPAAPSRRGSRRGPGAGHCWSVRVTGAQTVPQRLLGAAHVAKGRRRLARTVRWRARRPAP